MIARAVVAAVVAVAASPGCTVGDLVADGKRCPCGDGAICDPCTDTCVPPALVRVRCDDDPLAAVHVSDLRADWATPNVIHWSWTLGADDQPDLLTGFTLVVAETEEDVLTGEGTARSISADDNPELGAYMLRNTTDPNPVDHTMSYGHDPATTYYARLIARDASGRVSTTEIAERRTQEPSTGGRIDLFVDAPVPSVLPLDLTFEARCGDGGGACYQWTAPPTCPEDGTCYENLRLRNLPVTLADEIAPGPLETTAYLEYRVAIEGTIPAYWSEARIWFSGAPGPHGVRGFTTRATPGDDGGRTYQLPLRIFTRGSAGAVRHDDLATSLQEVGVGGRWAPGSVVRFRNVRVFW